jgi:hypothetical protein
MIYNQETSSLIFSLLQPQRPPRRCLAQSQNQILIIGALQYGTNTLSRPIYLFLHELHELQQRDTLRHRTRLHLLTRLRLILKGKS